MLSGNIADVGVHIALSGHYNSTQTSSASTKNVVSTIKPLLVRETVFWRVAMQRALMILIVISLIPAIHADPLNCNLAGYRATPGLVATVANDVLSVSWKGDLADLKISFAIDHGTPTIRQLAIRGKGGQWNTLATDVTPEFRVISGLRRVSAQQLRPESLAALGVKITPEIMDAWNHQEERGDDWLKIA